jgi:hypothetical protein
MYADDTQVYIHFYVEEFYNAVDLLNKVLAELVKYFMAHNLLLNVEKTQAIILGTSRLLNNLKGTVLRKVEINNQGVEYSEVVNNLGILMDSTLSWHDQSLLVIQKCFRSLAQAKRCFVYLPSNVRKNIVQSLIQPHFDYGATLFTDIPATTSIKLQRAQNACVRFISNVSKFEHITPFYKELNLLKLEQKRTLTIGLMMWKIMKYGNPPYLRCMFHSVSTVHSRANRNHSSNLVIPQHRTEKYAKSFCVTACKVYNYYKIYNFLHYSSPEPLRKFILGLLMY